jgi:ribose/xylose/arabinose/galactoside ABC-type transport system permease subunit
MTTQTAETSESTAEPTESRRKKTAAYLGKFTMPVVLIVAVVVLAAFVPSFRTGTNVVNVLQQNAIIGVVACGMTLMIIAGGFDLSVGAVGAAAGCLAGSISINYGMAVGVVAGLLLGIAVGLVNGLLISKARINAFVTTLGMTALVSGLLFVATEAKPIFGLPTTWTQIGFSTVGPIPTLVIVWLVVALASWALLRFTLLGKSIYAVGSNYEGSRRAGVRVDRVVISAFTIGGALAALGGLMLVGLSNTGYPTAGSTWALTAIAAVVLGGTALAGGSGGIGRTVVGVLILGVLANGLTLLSVSPYWQPAATGLLVIGAVGVESYRNRHQRR